MLKVRNTRLATVACTALFLNACANQASSRTANNNLAANAASPVADLAFGEKFCNEIVDPLMRGSNHWMACMGEVERLAATSISRAEMVERACKAIRGTLDDAGFLACMQNGAHFVHTESFAEPQKTLYARTASSIIACYEEVGKILPFYDETGRCGEDSELSAWSLSANSHMSAALEAFTPAERPESTVGLYSGTASFYNSSGRLCRFTLKFDYTGEDISANTSDFNCR